MQTKETTLQSGDSRLGIFLDADGVLWPDVGPGGILQGLPEARRRLLSITQILGRREDLFIGVVSNQTLAARALVPYEEFSAKVFTGFCSLQKDSLIDDFRVCFHHPKANYLPLRIENCVCRKPRPGMINDLMQSHALLPNHCLILGDRITDVLAGRRAKLNEAILLLGPRMFELNLGAQSHDWERLIQFKIARDFSDFLEILNWWIKNDK
jgi:D-glycero-D-manno-heptose 1,7-bisphosphate phosphatase